MQSRSDPQFEITQILATRVDSNGIEWLLVQWGCTWIPQSQMADGHLRTQYLKKPKLVQGGARFHIPVEDGQQTAEDAVVAIRRQKPKYEDKDPKMEEDKDPKTEDLQAQRLYASPESP